MNLVLNAAVPLTRTLAAAERMATVPVLDKNGRPESTLTAGRRLVATQEVPVPTTVVAHRLTDDEQRAREAHVLNVLARAMQEVGAVDARLATRFHGTVDLTTWEVE